MRALQGPDASPEWRTRRRQQVGTSPADAMRGLAVRIKRTCVWMACSEGRATAVVRYH